MISSIKLGEGAVGLSGVFALVLSLRGREKRKSLVKLSDWRYLVGSNQILVP